MEVGSEMEGILLLTCTLFPSQESPVQTQQVILQNLMNDSTVCKERKGHKINNKIVK